MNDEQIKNNRCFGKTVFEKGSHQEELENHVVWVCDWFGGYVCHGGFQPAGQVGRLYSSSIAGFMGRCSEGFQCYRWASYTERLKSDSSSGW